MSVRSAGPAGQNYSRARQDDGGGGPSGARSGPILVGTAGRTLPGIPGILSAPKAGKATVIKMAPGGYSKVGATTNV